MNRTQKSELEHWVEDNQHFFEEVMAYIKKEDPAEWARLYCRAVRLGIKPRGHSFFSLCKHGLYRLIIRLAGFRVFYRVYSLLH